MSVLDTIVSLDGTSYVTVANLSTNFAQGTGVVATGVANVHFKHLNMSMQGRHGMVRQSTRRLPCACVFDWIAMRVGTYLLAFTLVWAWGDVADAARKQQLCDRVDRAPRWLHWHHHQWRRLHDADARCVA